MIGVQQEGWWQFGADLTSLLNWEAVGAVLVFLTLLQAIWLAGQSARRIETQQLVTLRYIRMKLASLSVVEKLALGALREGIPLHEISSSPLIDELCKEFEGIEPTSLPTHAAMDAVEKSKSSLLTLRYIFDEECHERGLYEALLPFTMGYTSYAIAMIDRDIEDRNPSLLNRLWIRIRRGPPPRAPETFLGSAISKARSDLGSNAG